MSVRTNQCIVLMGISNLIQNNKIKPWKLVMIIRVYMWYISIMVDQMVSESSLNDQVTVVVMANDGLLVLEWRIDCHDCARS